MASAIRGRAEIQARHEESRFRTLFNAIPTGAVVHDRNGVIVEANPSACRILGVERDQLIGLSSLDGRWAAQHPDGRPAPGVEHAPMVALATGAEVRSQLLSFMTPEGERRWIEISADPLFENGPDRPSHAVCTFQDVTALLRSREALAERDRYFQTLFRAMPKAVYTTDRDGYLTFYNDAAATLWGQAPELGITRWSGAFALLDRDGAPLPVEESAMARAIRSRQPVRGEEAVIVRPNGDKVPVQPFPTPIFDPNGEMIGAINVLVDITQHKLADARQAHLILTLESTQADMARALDAAETANLAKSAFLANMSHELRTPLNGILGVAGALAQTELSERQAHMALLITESAQALEAILSDILDWSKIEAGKLKIERTEFEPRAALQVVSDLMEERATEKGLDFRVTFEGPVDGTFQGDPLRIRQVLVNLLSNAIKFTDAGKVELVVKLAPTGKAPDQHAMIIEVRDSGIGFDDASRARLFDRFEQADVSFTRRYGGTGLGLPICVALLELMGGDLQVESTPGAGSVFTATVPLVQRQVRRAPRSTARPAPVTPTGLRVLLAEDHPTNQKVVEIILQPIGAALMIVENGAKAVEAFEAHDFDLILMDMQMPVMDGLEAIRRIRATEAERNLPRTPIAMLSANAAEEHRLHSRACGADVHISKPVSPASLLAGVGDAIDAARRRLH